jgi:hypothetical protein
MDVREHLQFGMWPVEWLTDEQIRERFYPEPYFEPSIEQMTQWNANLRFLYGGQWDTAPALLPRKKG